MSAGGGQVSRPVGPLLPVAVAEWMWDHIDGFCFRFAEDRQRVEVRVGRCGSLIGGSSVLDCEDDGPVDYPELTVDRGDRVTTWSLGSESGSGVADSW